MLVAMESAAELRTRSFLSPQQTPALYVASGVVIVFSTSACNLYLSLENLCSLSESVS